MSKSLTGLIAATPTPMHADGSLWLEQIEPLVRHLAAGGISALYVCGSTGESASLSNLERQLVAEAFVSAARGRMPVAIQTGHNCLHDACQLASHAQQIGAAAISATAPSYFKPENSDVLLDCLAMVAKAAPRLPFYYYHIPSLVDVQVDVPTLLSRARDHIPNFRGVKFTATAIWEYQACLDVDAGHFDCLYGFDEMLLPALSVGARGAIGSTYGLAAPLYMRLLSAFNEGDLVTAREQQRKAVQMIRILLQHGGLPAIKAAMELIGIDCGPVRLPLAALSLDRMKSMENNLKQLGFFEWIRPATNSHSGVAAY